MRCDEILSGPWESSYKTDLLLIWTLEPLDLLLDSSVIDPPAHQMSRSGDLDLRNVLY